MTLREALEFARVRFEQNEIMYQDKWSDAELGGGWDRKRSYGCGFRANYIYRILNECGSGEEITECDVLRFLVEECLDPYFLYDPEITADHISVFSDIYKIVRNPDDVNEDLIDKMSEGAY